LANKRSLVDRINALPKWARDYIMQIETESDPAGTQRRLIEQQDLIRELTAEIAELKGVPSTIVSWTSGAECQAGPKQPRLTKEAR
jgi:hypothetical protein